MLLFLNNTFQVQFFIVWWISHFLTWRGTNLKYVHIKFAFEVLKTKVFFSIHYNSYHFWTFHPSLRTKGVKGALLIMPEARLMAIVFGGRDGSRLYWQRRSPDCFCDFNKVGLIFAEKFVFSVVHMQTKSLMSICRSRMGGGHRQSLGKSTSVNCPFVVVG